MRSRLRAFVDPPPPIVPAEFEEAAPVFNEMERQANPMRDLDDEERKMFEVPPAD